MTDIEFMQNPDIWPAWPFCPLKKRGVSPPECGYLLNTSLRGAHTAAVVYQGNIFDAKPSEAPKVTYATFEELAKRWIVD